MNHVVPALCAIAILSGPAHADSLNHDESQFTGWLHAISEMQGSQVRYHSQPIADFPHQLARINRENQRLPFQRRVRRLLGEAFGVPSVWWTMPGLRRSEVCAAL